MHWLIIVAIIIAAILLAPVIVWVVVLVTECWLMMWVNLFQFFKQFKQLGKK